ncbi:hypothetical protein C0991_012332 [Blastosporella zonata]|nr:hypothetical protein C0991_012332 [Blastosporella zonata]
MPNPTTEPILESNPQKFLYVGCKLCKKWKTWAHGAGMTTCYRNHLKTCHAIIYEATIKEKHLKHADKPTSSEAQTLRGPFSLKTFWDLLQRWITADDQSINVVECPEFQELLVYLGDGNIDDDDIPCRTKITKMIQDAYKDVREKIKEGLHFFFEIINEYGIISSIGQITMDNASNNNTLMEAVEDILQTQKIPFNRDGNRIRCFPHIVNLACQAIMDALKITPAAHGLNPANFQYLKSLELDLIGICRSVVNACQASSQCRQELKSTIREGNEKGTWIGELKDGQTHLRVLQLLRDCKTHWSSTYLMIDRMIYLYPAIQKFLLNINQSDLSHHLLTSQQLNILCDIHQVLEIPHAAQELLSAERTLTLSLSLPLYELIIKQWRILQTTIPELAPHIKIGIQKLEDYLQQA